MSNTTFFSNGDILHLIKWINATLIIILVLMPCVQCQKTMEDWFNVGLALYEQSKYDEALKAYDESIRLDQNVPSVWYNKALILQLWAITVKPFRLTIGPLRSIPQYAEAWRYKGNALLDNQGELDEAIKALNEAIRAKSKRCQSLVQQRLCSQTPGQDNRGQCSLRQGQGAGF
jgi:tetratricopeptide (TPR) repeat protein